MSISKKYTSRRPIVLVIALLVLALTAFPAFALDEEAICSTLGANWSAFTYQCSYDYYGTNPAGDPYSYSVKIPTRVMYDSSIQDTLIGFINVAINTYMSNVETSPASGVGAQYVLEIEPTIFQHNADIFSVVFYSYEFLGGAHPNQYASSFTFNRATGQVLRFSDLFNPESDPLLMISVMVESQLMTRMGNDESLRGGIEAGAGMNIDNYNVFALTDDALLIFFPPYQVAPYVFGGQSVRIPLSDISTLLNF